MSGVLSRGKLLTAGEAARELGVSAASLAKWRLVSGSGPSFVKIGGRVRYELAELEEFIARRRRRSTSDPGPQ